ncbi:hypothetical protein [Streptomyces odontomachi]|uniref:hypothetical protein n=1 Tax=Streptomyces odontomachi TaxID=2944940 RepID=UPI0021096DED|nr:hypothetical protein [Streptomyces sp. ODS25]
MADKVEEPVSVSRRIESPAGDIFRVLADPRRHRDMDGSGMLREAGSDTVLTGVGDVFVMKMHYEPYGDYEVHNHVVEFELDRRIGWEPRPGPGHPDHGSTERRFGQRWIYDLEPDGPAATVVTEIFDASRLPEDKRLEMEKARPFWVAAIEGSLRRLDEVCTGRTPEADS